MVNENLKKVKPATYHIFQGKSFPCEDWVKWIAKDADGCVFGFMEKPVLNNEGYYEVDTHNFSYLGRIN